MALLIVFALFIFGRSVLSGPRLALLVLIVQSATHLILGEMTGNSFAMSISHILGGIASFTLLTKSDEFWFAVKKLVLHIVSPKILTLPQIKLHEFKVFYRDLACWFSVLLTSSNGLRAPPNSLSKGIFAWHGTHSRKFLSATFHTHRSLRSSLGCNRNLVVFH